MTREKKTMDGNQAAAHVAYAYSEVAAIYPITPSSGMAEHADEWSTDGRKNIFGQPVTVSEMQSEAGAAGAVHGSLVTGALTTTFTASQGLLLMIPNIYRIAGELLPGVFHVAARAIATHALSIFGDHSDIYACRQTGAAIFASGSVQEVMDLTPVAHLASIKGSIPFINFFDGFRTSHEMQKIEVWDYDTLKEMADMEAIQAFRQKALNPNRGKVMGSAQNPDVFFQNREAANTYYDALPAIVEEYLGKINEKLGTNYGLFNYYGAPDAEHVIIAMGSVCETIEETVDYLNAQGGKTGLLKVHLYRPFQVERFLEALPETVRQISVLDRTKEPGSIGEPLYLDVVAALSDSRFKDVSVFSGRYGLASKNTTPDQINAVFKNTEKSRFTIGIVDDVTHLSLDTSEKIHLNTEGTHSCKFWGLGGDGTVSANKSSVKIIGNHTDLYAQAYFDYDSKKSRGVTISHLRFGKERIRSTYLIHNADFVACHNPAYLYKYNMVQEVKKGGTFLLNSYWKEDELDKNLPGQVKRYIAENNIRFYMIDAMQIGREVGLGGKISTILQAAFFRVANILPIDDVVTYMKNAANASYGKQGDSIVKMNYDAIDRGIQDVVEVQIPESWLQAEDDDMNAKLLPDRQDRLDYVENLQRAINAQKGGDLPVSAFMPYVNGESPTGTTAHERRFVTTEVPKWIPENCIQCNRCAYVCPHAVIRPAILNEEEQAAAPKDMITMPALAMPGYEFAIVVSEVDCTGCSSCASVCPGKQGKKALEMCSVTEYESRQASFDYAKSLPEKPEIFEKFKISTVKGSQFKQPLMEFSGACAGCGETPYARLVTQLFGDRMFIANATGCSTIWGNSAPATAYTTNHLGQGPAWSNSLFEDGAEFGYGMHLAQETLREALREKIEGLLENTDDEVLKDAASSWLDTYSDGERNRVSTNNLILALEQSSVPEAAELLLQKDFLGKKSQWIFGGDGWAYDIGFGGLDHVIASGKNVNILIFDTEVYSNTGGQASKATPTGSTAKFAVGGKVMRKKDLGSIAMSYGYVYVAQIAMGADYNQTLKAIAEAEHYDGPSVIIAYAPCISHGIRTGMGSSQAEEARAVESGYWHLFRYNPMLKEEGKNPFSLDSKEPTLDYKEFLAGENRYDILRRTNPEKAEYLFDAAAQNAKERYTHLSRLVAFYEP